MMAVYYIIRFLLTTISTKIRIDVKHKSIVLQTDIEESINKVPLLGLDNLK